MYSLTAKFRPSRRAGKEGSVYYIISFNGKERCLTSSIKELDNSVLTTERKRIAQDLRIIYCVIEELENRGDEYTMDDIVAKSAESLGPETKLRYKVMALGDRIAVDRNVVRIHKNYARIESKAADVDDNTLLTVYIDHLSNLYCAQGRRIGKSLLTLHNSLSKYLSGKRLCLSSVNEEFISEYYKYVRDSVAASTLSYYMNTFRNVVNTAIKAGLMNISVNWGAYIQVRNLPKTRDVRTLSRQSLQQIIALNLNEDPYLELIRDTYIFSFYAHGMELTDIATLKKSNLIGNTLQYNRRKSGKAIKVLLGEKALEIVNRHTEPDSYYLLPLLQYEGKQITYTTLKVLSYRALQSIGRMLSPEQKLSFSMTRASWQAMIENINLAEAII